LAKLEVISLRLISAKKTNSKLDRTLTTPIIHKCANYCYSDFSANQHTGEYCCPKILKLELKIIHRYSSASFHLHMDWE